MSDVRYDQLEVAREFDRVRNRRPESLEIWCRHIAAQLDGGNGHDRLDGARLPVVDVGSGTGIWSEAIAVRCGIPVVGVEPSIGMRARAATARQHTDVSYVGGSADTLPLRSASASGAWLSTVIHQFPDLPAALAELRRVLVPGAPMLVRTCLIDRHDDAELFQHFPAARKPGWLTTERLLDATESAGFCLAAQEEVDEPVVGTYDEILPQMSQVRHADSSFADLTDDEWEAGLASMRRARDRGESPRPFPFDLLVLT